MLHTIPLRSRTVQAICIPTDLVPFGSHSNTQRSEVGSAQTSTGEQTWWGCLVQNLWYKQHLHGSTTSINIMPSTTPGEGISWERFQKVTAYTQVRLWGYLAQMSGEKAHRWGRCGQRIRWPAVVHGEVEGGSGPLFTPCESCPPENSRSYLWFTACSIPSAIITQLERIAVLRRRADRVFPIGVHLGGVLSNNQQPNVAKDNFDRRPIQVSRLLEGLVIGKSSRNCSQTFLSPEVDWTNEEWPSHSTTFRQTLIWDGGWKIIAFTALKRLLGSWSLSLFSGWVETTANHDYKRG